MNKFGFGSAAEEGQRDLPDHNARVAKRPWEPAWLQVVIFSGLMVNRRCMAPACICAAFRPNVCHPGVYDSLATAPLGVIGSAWPASKQTDRGSSLLCQVSRVS